MRVAAARVLGFRLARHRLDRRAPAGSLAETARALCGVHAQLAASAELALWARVEDLERDDVRSALEEERTLVKTWAMRGTLHLLTAEDLALFVGLFRPQWDDPGGAWLRGFGVTKKQYDAIVTGVPKVLGARPRTREQLADKLGELAGPEVREKLLSGWGALLKPSARRGDLCFGPNRGRNVTFVRPDRWLGRLPRIDREEAQREVIRRFLAAYGPATVDDLSRWLGLRTGLRRMLAAIEDELVEVELAGQPAWLLAADLEALKAAPPPKSVRLLPAFDPYVVGFRPRELFVDPREEARIFRPQAWFSPVLLVNGRAAGIWERERRGPRIEVRIEPFALAEEVDRLGEFLDAPAELEVAA
jgi:Winged helix DNA-binding domain